VKGRKPKPTQLKVLHGTQRASRVPAAPIKSDPPTAPPFLDEEALAEWNRLAAENNGTIEKADRALTAAFCQTWSRWVAAEMAMAETGPVVRSTSGAPMLNPYFSVSQRCLKELRAYAAELGLSPTSRTRLNTPTKPKSRLSEFIKNG